MLDVHQKSRIAFKSDTFKFQSFGSCAHALILIIPLIFHDMIFGGGFDIDTTCNFCLFLFCITHIFDDKFQNSQIGISNQ